MGIDEPTRIDGVGGANAPQQNPPAAAEPTEFRRLLERLESVAKQSKPDEVEDVTRLREEMQKADDNFAAAMDLRQRLERAYRDSQR